MKYYEIVARTYIRDNSVEVKELQITKETPKQIQFTGSKTCRTRFNKADLNKLFSYGQYIIYVVFEEGKEAEARKLIAEHMNEEMNFHLDKAQVFEKLIAEVSK